MAKLKILRDETGFSCDVEGRRLTEQKLLAMKERSRSHGFRRLRSGGAEYLSPLEAPYRFRDLKNDSVDAMVTELGIQMVEYEKSILRNQRMKLAFENGLRSSPNDLQVEVRQVVFDGICGAKKKHFCLFQGPEIANAYLKKGAEEYHNGNFSVFLEKASHELHRQYGIVYDFAVKQNGKIFMIRQSKFPGPISGDSQFHKWFFLQQCLGALQRGEIFLLWRLSDAAVRADPLGPLNVDNSHCLVYHEMKSSPRPPLTQLPSGLFIDVYDVEIGAEALMERVADSDLSYPLNRIYFARESTSQEEAEVIRHRKVQRAVYEELFPGYRQKRITIVMPIIERALRKYIAQRRATRAN
jgi:hypothetical protein